MFIFAGLGLATIKFLRDGHPRLLSPTIFPSPNPLIYNAPYGSVFVGNYYSLNRTEWSDPYGVNFVTDPTKDNYMD